MAEIVADSDFPFKPVEPVGVRPRRATDSGDRRQVSVTEKKLHDTHFADAPRLCPVGVARRHEAREAQQSVVRLLGRRSDSSVMFPSQLGSISGLNSSKPAMTVISSAGQVGGTDVGDEISLHAFAA